MNPRQDRVLGKGLSALISGAADESGRLGDREARLLSVDAIGLNPDQPRKAFNEKTLAELADSIRQVGVLQPVLVRRLRPGEEAPLSLSERLDPQEGGPRPARPEYCLVAGERRVRAAALAGVEEIPAIVCSYEETEALRVSLLENIHREDLNPVEEAATYQELLDAYGATQEELATMLGKSRSGVANTLRMLSLAPEILEMLREGGITRGHAKAMLAIEDEAARLRLARLCRTRGLSVRECEQRAQVLAGGARARRRRKAGPEESPAVRALRERVEERLGSPVRIERDVRGKGQIVVRFFSDEDLTRVLVRLGIDTDLS